MRPIQNLDHRTIVGLIHDTCCRRALQDLGFPPEFSYYSTESTGSATAQQETSDTSSFLRISGIDLSGAMTGSIVSRPLEKELAAISMDLDIFDTIDSQIRELSEKNRIELGRPGCTLDELYDLLYKYIGRVFAQALAKIYQDLAKDGQITRETPTHVMEMTARSVKNYVDDSSSYWMKNKMENLLVGKLTKLGFDSDEEEKVISGAVEGLKRMASKELKEGSRFRNLLSSLKRDDQSSETNESEL